MRFCIGQRIVINSHSGHYHSYTLTIAPQQEASGQTHCITVSDCKSWRDDRVGQAEKS